MVRPTTLTCVTYFSDERKVRTFDKDSTLDAGLKTILKHTYILPPHATTELHENAAPESSTKARGGESEESMVDPGQRRTRDLEKQLSELKVAESELEYKYQSEKGMRMGAEERISRLLVDLKESQDLVAQLEKQPPKVV